MLSLLAVAAEANEQRNGYSADDETKAVAFSAEDEPDRQGDNEGHGDRSQPEAIKPLRNRQGVKGST